jgi:ABC-type multidrug transport system fused ATPase/permease subunit
MWNKGLQTIRRIEQRIDIATAILQKQVLHLDQATSALGEESQRRCKVALDNVLKTAPP